ncbi:hypothetical protein CDD80_3563 [Ophiocordyceps camponoti-rufipedis]|uniref:Glycosyltransferase family 25 protein n=1 Tax=Ophiocordyceps camponoti-rufipedis TaxID=2004952 RepID=A0A2C5Z1A8_9HYPO|nr:hypothetical protein CDD80_3563 [Ophiocordyceps camponoti-rufipedis]
MLPLKPHRLRTSKVVLFLLLFCITWLLTSHLLASFLHRPPHSFVSTSTNATLGFGRIFVVSQQGSPRRKSIVQAANVTELMLTVPAQPVWTDEDERRFRLERDSSIQKGSLLAWLGHLHALQQYGPRPRVAMLLRSRLHLLGSRFLDSGVETALFLEDDVDWDIRLRTVQAPLVSAAARRLLSGSSNGRRYPYGDPERWDLLYLGHCGDYWHGMDIDFVDGHVQPSDLESTPHVAFADPSLSHPDNLHPFTASLLKNLGVRNQTRLFHRSVFPLCTFGYALSRAGAHRLLQLGRKEPSTKGHKAYDVLILLSCRDYGLRCWTVNPELFHHVPGPSIIDVQQGNKDLPPVDLAAKDQIDARGETPNIDCGFWDGSFAFRDEDVARLEWLREEVGRKGICLKSGRQSEPEQ